MNKKNYHTVIYIEMVIASFFFIMKKCLDEIIEEMAKEKLLNKIFKLDKIKRF
jgi:hypothetical protein